MIAVLTIQKYAPGNGMFRSDRIGWLRRLFDLSCAEYDRLNLDREDAVAELTARFERGLDGLSENETRQQLVRIERAASELTRFATSWVTDARSKWR